MDSRGFFGALVLIAALEVLFFMNGSSNELFEQQKSIENSILSIEEAGFRRTEAEIYLDKAIEKAIFDSSLPPIEAEKIKLFTNIAIIEAFRELKLEETGICKKTFSNQNKKVKELSLETIGKVTKVSTIKAGEATIIQFTVSGSIGQDLFPCAEISNKKFSTQLRIPKDYSKIHVVLN